MELDKEVGCRGGSDITEGMEMELVTRPIPTHRAPLFGKDIVYATEGGA
jgi:hypothetical protein